MKGIQIKTSEFRWQCRELLGFLLGFQVFKASTLDHSLQQGIAFSKQKEADAGFLSGERNFADSESNSLTISPAAERHRLVVQRQGLQVFRCHFLFSIEILLCPCGAEINCQEIKATGNKSLATYVGVMASIALMNEDKGLPMCKCLTNFKLAEGS